MDAFGTRAAPTRSSFPSSSLHAATSPFKSLLRRRKSNGSRRWKPPALHPFTFAIAIATPIALIVTLILLLRRSQRDNGIIFAPDINALPLSRTFMYQYFPTILAVIFSIFWAWIDLETKRLEPYYRLSEEKGALGKDSLLLSYPFGFVPMVPVKAFRQRHWPVFWASFALLLVTWGLVPTQAGIFSTGNVTRNITTSFEVSTGSMPLTQQAGSLTLQYLQSSYGITSLNETLPPFMARNYTLRPFSLSPLKEQDAKEVDAKEWTVPTTLYSLDLNCEPAIPFTNTFGIKSWNNSGCALVGLQMGNDTIDERPRETSFTSIKAFSARHVGFWNALGYADYYLSQTCPVVRNHTFFAAFTRNKEKGSDPAQNVTAIFCEPTYYSREVNATVDVANRQPVRFVPLGPKQPLQDIDNVVNVTLMEMILSGGYPLNRIRANELPTDRVPNFVEQVMEKNLTNPLDRMPMVGFSTMIDERPLGDFLDWQNLARSYEDAYRLIFARAVVEVLDGKFKSRKQVAGTRTMATDAVLLEPLFTYIVIGFLSVIVVATIVLVCLSSTRTLVLRSDPSTIGTVMGYVAQNEALLRDFEDLDCYTLEQIEQTVQQKRYQLIDRDDQIHLIERRPATASNRQSAPQAVSTLRTSSTKDIDKPVRPIEFSLGMSLLYISVFIALATVLATVFIKARKSGLPLPSRSKFVQNLLENYIPTAIATLIEPLWVLINRLLCLLQPIEELQSCNAKAKDSVDLDYSSLPPQLVVFKALRARHFVLAAVCSMALLANILSVAFAGLFNHDVIAIFKSTTLKQPYNLSFVSINGSVGPITLGSSGTGVSSSGAYRGGDGRDQFYILASNLSQGTPFPSWTDETMFYLPFMGIASGNATEEDQFEKETATLGAGLDCETVHHEDLSFWQHDTTQPGPILNKTVRMGSKQARCSSNVNAQLVDGPEVDLDIERVCQTGKSALELVLTLDALGVNATQEEKEACWGTVIFGWVRNPEGSCKSPNVTALNTEDSLFLQCQPRLKRGRALVRVDTEGRLAKRPQTTMPARNLQESDVREMFENGPSDLIAQSNRYIFSSGRVPWHNDSIATDFFNYFLAKAANNNRFLDPKLSAPSWNDIEAPLQETYASLFAIWLGGNKDRLLLPRSESEGGSSLGWRLVNEERIFVSTALFGIAFGILCTYALVACMVYLRRPGEYLARLPTNLASVIPLFAGSTAVQGMRGLSGLQKKARAEHFELLDYRYGYGSYIGVDSRVHIGIEKTPFVRPRRKINSN